MKMEVIAHLRFELSATAMFMTAIQSYDLSSETLDNGHA